VGISSDQRFSKDIVYTSDQAGFQSFIISHFAWQDKGFVFQQSHGNAPYDHPFIFENTALFDQPGQIGDFGVKYSAKYGRSV